MTTQPQGLVPAFTAGDRLRKARELTGMDQSQFAEAIGVSRGSVSNYERSEAPPRPIVIRAWALATGVSEEWLSTGLGIVHTPPDDGASAGNASELARLTDRKRRRAPTSHTGALNADKRRYGVAA